MKPDIAVISQPFEPAGPAEHSHGPAELAAPAPRTAALPSQPSVNIGKSRDRLVMGMIALVSIAVGAGLNVQFGWSIIAAAFAAAAFWAVLMMTHHSAARSDQVDKLKTEVHRLETEVAQLKGITTHIRGVRDTAPADVNGVARNPVRGGTPRGERPLPPEINAANASLKLEPDARWEAPKPAPKSKLVNPELAVTDAAQGASGSRGSSKAPAAHVPPPPPPPQTESSLWPGTSTSSTDPMRDAWAFRPKVASDVHASVDMPEGESFTPVYPPVSTIDRELEVVQRKIKALAAEVNAAEASRGKGGPEAPGFLPSALDQSVGALRSTSQTMRDRSAPASPVAAATLPPPRIRESAGGPDNSVAAPANLSTPTGTASPAQQPGMFASADFLIPATAERIAVSIPDAESNAYERGRFDMPSLELPPVRLDPAQPPSTAVSIAAPPALAPAVDPRIAAIAQAIQSGSMDVMFSPIVGLQDQAVRHYEVSVRLRTATGAHIDNADDVLELAGSDLVGLFDSARLARTTSFAGRLEALKKPGSVLSPVAGGSMTDGRFLETFARLYEERQTMSAQIVLTFPQADVATFGQAAWQALGDMHAFGFRFAIDKVRHLDMDFEALGRHGFAFVKLPARAFIEGLPLASGSVSASDICRHLSGSGMTLVADAIDDEALRARVFGFGVVFGQGQLFGGARAINLDAAGGRTAAA